MGGVLHPVSPGQGMVATRVPRKTDFFLPEPLEVEDFVGLPSLKGSGVNFFAVAWPVMTRESCSKSKRHLLWDRDLKHFI